jgi:cell division protein FtsW (lipid II flippase)
MAVCLFCLLFILSAFLFPPATIRQEPLIAVVVSSAIFLMAFRQILALRAWQGEPWNMSAFMDSAVSPFLFILCLIFCCERFPLITLISNSLARVSNFFFHSNFNMKDYDIKGETVASVGFLILFGLILFGLFGTEGNHSLIEKDFFMVAVLLITISVFINVFDWIDEHLISRLSSWVLGGGAGATIQTLTANRAGIFSAFIVVLAASLLIAPLIGSREVIAFLPGRPRPDIILQIALLIIIAYLADVFTKQEERGLSIHFVIIALFLVFIFAVCFIQGVLAKDFGFFIFIFPPLFIMALMSTWNKDKRVVPSILICIVVFMIIFAWYMLKPDNAPIDSSEFNRILFCFFKERLRAEYFFDYLANIPVVWASTQSFFGAGFFNSIVDHSLRNTCVNDHVASVFIQGEFGAFGSILTLGIYACIIWSVLVFIGDITSDKVDERSGTRFHMWILMGLCLMIAWASIYPFLANMGVAPLTGKNLPLLGLDSKNDVIRYGFLLGLMVRYMKKISDF